MFPILSTRDLSSMKKEADGHAYITIHSPFTPNVYVGTLTKLG